MECTGHTPAQKECTIRLALPSSTIKRTLEVYGVHGNGNEQFLANEMYICGNGECSITLVLPSALVESTVKHAYAANGEEPDRECLVQYADPTDRNLGQCSFCGIFFHSQSHVTHHERSHTGLKPCNITVHNSRGTLLLDYL